MCKNVYSLVQASEFESATVMRQITDQMMLIMKAVVNGGMLMVSYCTQVFGQTPADLFEIDSSTCLVCSDAVNKVEYEQMLFHSSDHPHTPVLATYFCSFVAYKVSEISIFTL